MARVRRNAGSSSPVTSPVSAEAQPSVHEEMFRTLLRTPHRDYDETLDIHIRQFERDPNFYGKLAFWAVGMKNNVVRDVNEIFIAVLFNSQFQEHKELAYVLLQDLPPYQVERVGRIFTGFDEIVRLASYEPKLVSGRFGVTVEPMKYSKNHPDESLRGKPIPERKVTFSKKSKIRAELVRRGSIGSSQTEFSIQTLRVHHQCLNNRHYKGMLRKAVRSYLRQRERDRAQMEGALLRSRSVMQKLYAKSQTLPENNENGWIHQFLFKGVAPEGTRIAALRQLAKSTDPVEQAKIISEAKIPYPVAATVVTNMTPSVLVALIEVMSPQELLANLGSLQKRGAMDNADIKALIESKIKSVQKGKGRIDALKGASAAAAVEGLDEDIRKAAVEVTDHQLKRHGAIRAKTAIFIDKSGSMSNAIELGKQVAAAVAQSCVDGNMPVVYLFDAQPVPIVWSTSDGDITKKSAWDKKLQMFRAAGGTAPGMAVKALITKKTLIEQIVVITDEGENSDAYSFARSLKDYEKEFGVLPSVVIVRLGTSCDIMEKSSKKEGIQTDVFPVGDIDKVSMPNLIQLLSRKSLFEIVQEILALPLPSKNEYDVKHGIGTLSMAAAR